MGDFELRDVLIVEDEWLVRMELADSFADLGMTVIESASAEHGAQMLYANPGIALLVTDIRLMGPRNGWELAIEARTINPAIPVIYLSANPSEPQWIVAGGIFIDKPARMETVIEIARQLLGDAA